MKHFSIQYAVLFVALAVLLTACTNVFAPQNVKTSAGLQITVANGNERTLFPKTNFTKYELRFQNATASRPAITLTDGKTSITVTDLADGDWDITAVGYVTINGTEYAAAEGTARVAVTSEKFQGITIPITASMSGPDGFFSYSVSFPEDKVQDARLVIYSLDSWSGDDIDLLTTPEGTLTLVPGYYMMTIQLYTDYEIAARTEVVHIYSNMETVADYHFTEDDFTRTITLSGTVDVTVDGEPLDENDGVRITAYRDAGYSDYVAQTWTGQWRDYAWSMKIASFDADTPLYFTVRVWFQNGDGEIERGAGTVIVKDQNISGINLDYDFTEITLSGTAAVTVNGAAPQNGSVSVIAYRNADYSGNSVGAATVDLQNNTWSMTMFAFNADTPLYLRVRINTSYWKNIDIPVTAKDQSISGIDLGAVNLQIINLSGTVGVTLSGSTPPQQGYAWVSVYHDADYSNYATSAMVNLQNNTWSASNAWSFDTDASLYFSVGFNTNKGSFEKRTNVNVPMGNQDISDINLGAVDFDLIFLSGTAAVTVGGVPLESDQVTITAYRNANHSDRVDMAWTHQGEGYAWSMVFEPFAADTPLYFTVRTWVQDGEVERDVGSVTVKDQNIPDINLDYDLAGLTLSGTVTVTVNGLIPQSNVGVYVEAYRDANYWYSVASAPVNLQDNTWSMTMLAFDTDTPLYFQIRISASGNSYRKNIDVPVTAKDQNIPNIDLGAVNLQRINLSGTVEVTVNGSAPPQDGYVAVIGYRNPDYSNQAFEANINLQNNTWYRNDVWSFDTNASLYFSVRFHTNSGPWIEKRTGVNVTMNNQSIYDIDLDTVNFDVITLSGTVAITVNGGTPEFIMLTVYRDAAYSDRVYDIWVDRWGDNTWSMSLEPFDTDTPLYFEAEVYTNSGGHVRKELGALVTVKDQDISDIAIVHDFTD